MLSTMTSSSSPARSRVPSLLSLCQRVAVSNAHLISSLGDLDYSLVKPILEVDAETLQRLEDASPHLKQNSQEIWESLCRKNNLVCVSQCNVSTADMPKLPDHWKDRYFFLLEQEAKRLDEAGNRLKSQVQVRDQRKKEREVKYRQVPQTHTKRPRWNSYATPNSAKSLFQKTRAEAVKVHRTVAHVPIGTVATTSTTTTTTATVAPSTTCTFTTTSASTASLSYTSSTTATLPLTSTRKPVLPKPSIALPPPTMAAVNGSSGDVSDRVKVATVVRRVKPQMNGRTQRPTSGHKPGSACTELLASSSSSASPPPSFSSVDLGKAGRPVKPLPASGRHLLGSPPPSSSSSSSTTASSLSSPPLSSSPPKRKVSKKDPMACLFMPKHRASSQLRN